MDWIFVPHACIGAKVWCGWKGDMWYCEILKDDLKMKWHKHKTKEVKKANSSAKKGAQKANSKAKK